MKRLLATLKPKLVGRFAAVGLVSTAGFFIVSNALVSLGGIETMTAGYIAYAAMVPLSFIGHRRVTFQSNNAISREWIRFCVCQAINLFLVWFVTGLGERSAWPHWVSFAAISILIPLVSFVTMQLWVFRTTPAR